jgi:hypothetical protein
MTYTRKSSATMKFISTLSWTTLMGFLSEVKHDLNIAMEMQVKRMKLPLHNFNKLHLPAW